VHDALGRGQAGRRRGRRRSEPAILLSVALALAGFAASAATIALPAVLRAGEPDLRPVARVAQVTGGTRAETAALLSRTTFEAPVPVLYVANGELTSLMPLPTSEHAPLLYVDQSGVPAITLGEVERLRPQRIVVLGDAAAVSEDVVLLLQASGAGVHRVAGASPEALAANLSRHVFRRGARTVYIADAGDPAAVAVASAAAWRRGAPVLLCRAGGFGQETIAELRRLAPRRVHLVGGQRGTAQTVRDSTGGARVSTLGSADITFTAIALARHAGVRSEVVYLLHRPQDPALLAAGGWLSDGLAAAPVAAARQAGLYWIESSLTPELRQELDRLAPAHIVLVGAAADLPVGMRQELEDIARGAS
jgi:hypothetical protein